MNHSFSWIMAITIPEWLSWVATGHLRCGNRMTLVNGSNDLAGFTSLMASTPDITFRDDGAFILADLKPTWSEFIEAFNLAPTLNETWLRIEGVNKFFPVSERGSRLLQFDAERANVVLGQPVFQQLWLDWSDHQAELRTHWKGMIFAGLFGFVAPDIERLPDGISQYLLKDCPLPKADVIAQSRATCAFGWASAFSLLVSFIGDEEKTIQSNRLNLQEVVKALRQDYAVNKPVIYESPYFSIADELSAVIAEKASLNISIRFLVIVFHYVGLLADEKEIELEPLVKDLAMLIDAGDSILAANAAYLIGRKMEDTPVSALRYTQLPNLFPALISKSIAIPDWRNFIVPVQQAADNENSAEQQNLPNTDNSNSTLFGDTSKGKKKQSTKRKNKTKGGHSGY